MQAARGRAGAMQSHAARGDARPPVVRVAVDAADHAGC
jgi:hypothetical protein